MVKLIQSIIIVGYISFEFGYRGMYVIPADCLALIVFGASWMYSEAENKIMYRVTNSAFFGVVFSYVLAFGFEPTLEQFERLSQYSEFNKGYSVILDERLEGEEPKSSISAARLIVEMHFKGFLLTPPEPVYIDLIGDV